MFTSLRTFSSLRPSLLKTTQKSSQSFLAAFKSSRTFMSDSSPVISRPDQGASWKRFAITAVRSPLFIICRRVGTHADTVFRVRSQARSSS